MHKLITKNLTQLQKYCQQFVVERLYVFGSVTNDSFSETSDVDFLIGFKNIPSEKYADNYFQLHELFEIVLKRKVDLITEKSFSNPYFIEKVNQTKALIYEARNSEIPV
jgi:uncharacterized protein